MKGLRTRRLLASGGTRLHQESAEFYAALGRELASERGLVVCTGGFSNHKGESSVPSADSSVIAGVLAGLKESGEDADERIETMLPEDDWSELERFRHGKVIVLRNRSARARRFRLVHLADAIVTIEGSHGTRELIENALASETPVLPLPFSGGSSAEFWSIESNREQLLEWFGPTTDTLPTYDLSSMNRAAIRRLARAVKELLLVRLSKKCLVCMPYGAPFDDDFDDLIAPAIRSCDVLPVRLDRIDIPGNALRILREAIAACDVTLIDVTGSNPNVMYELGLVHGLDKPAIVTCRKSASGALPFNIRNERILYYEGGEDLGRALAPLM